MAGIRKISPGCCIVMDWANRLVGRHSFLVLRTELLKYNYLGSMDESCLTSHEDLPPPTGKGATRPAAVTPIRGSAPHALMYDLTHDNESPLHKRSAEDALSTGALVTFGLSATGSNKGFDDLYPKLLDLVGDNRKYETSDGGKVDRGIAKVKKVLNQLHTEMVLAGFKEGHVHQEGDVSPLTLQLVRIHLIL